MTMQDKKTLTRCAAVCVGSASNGLPTSALSRASAEMMAAMGPKKKLSIAPCTLTANGNVRSVNTGRAYELMLNPSRYKHEKNVQFQKDDTVGKIGSESRFKSIEPESLSFDFVLDGTGVVSGPIPGKKVPDVVSEVGKLSAVVYQYKGKNHEPNVVQILWGALLFFGRLKNMNTEYVLFNPSGEPLRAKMSLSFRSYMSPKEEALRKNNSSPDLSHRIVFREGDSLPLLCHEVYRDSAYYTDVARYNNLVDFRNIEPGTEIAFPPLTS